MFAVIIFIGYHQFSLLVLRPKSFENVVLLFIFVLQKVFRVLEFTVFTLGCRLKAVFHLLMLQAGREFEWLVNILKVVVFTFTVRKPTF
jgi:hypothetical protein